MGLKAVARSTYFIAFNTFYIEQERCIHYG